MTEEIEAKFFVDNYNDMIKKVLAIATFKKAAHELTIMYDNNNKTLFRDDARLRLRKIIDLKDKKEECELSYKKPKTREGIKIEEELEVKTSSFLDTEGILTKLGYSKISSYERIRDTFYANNCKITIDSFPFGDLLEIEGEKEEDIINVSKKLGLDIKNNTTKSCDDIYADICRANAETIKEHIIFNENTLSEKEKLRRSYYANHLKT